MKNRIKIYAETDLHRFLYWCIVILRKGEIKIMTKENKDDLIDKLMIFVVDKDEELQKLMDKHEELRPVGEKIREISRNEELNKEEKDSD